MSPPLLDVEREGPEGVLKEHNYFGVSDSSSVDSSTPTSICLSHHSKDNLNLKATELRLGLPGSQSPPRDSDFDEKPLFPLTPALSSSHNPAVSGTKRPYDNTPSQHTWMFHSSSNASKHTSHLNLPLNGALSSSTPAKDHPPKPLQHPSSPNTNTNTNTPAPKAQVVGWPPIRSFRKNTLATTPKNSDPLFVKVSMDGAPYLRKVDLTTYTTYQQLSSALQNMFTCFTLGQCGTPKASGSENLSETKLKDLLNGSEYVLTYEDKDGDWMLVGDVPWEMFIDTCKRLKIMKSSDAIGLAPRAMEKSKNRC